jgi:Tfp pilus assembly protein PilF
MAFYQKTLELSPNNPFVYNNYGAMAINEDGRIQEGIGFLKHALEHIGTHTNLKGTILTNLARAFGQITDYEQQAQYQNLLFKHIGLPFEIVEVDDEDEEE